MMTTGATPLGHVCAFDSPVSRHRSAQHGNPVPRDRRDRFQSNCNCPKRKRLCVGECARYPEWNSGGMPDADAQKLR